MEAPAQWQTGQHRACTDCRRLSGACMVKLILALAWARPGLSTALTRESHSQLLAPESGHLLLWPDSYRGIGSTAVLRVVFSDDAQSKFACCPMCLGTPEA